MVEVSSILQSVVFVTTVWTTITVYIFKSQDNVSLISAMFIMTTNFALIRALINVYYELGEISQYIETAIQSLVLWMIVTGVFFGGSIFVARLGSRLRRFFERMEWYSNHYHEYPETTIDTILKPYILGLLGITLSFMVSLLFLVIFPYVFVWKWSWLLEFEGIEAIFDYISQRVLPPPR
ncbi:hypothetical protein QRT08_02560 [Halalkalicoccus sp. NIPERK01]|nr:hypothetical protein [Halalkalicoccus sp. NIPERK01]